MTDEAPKQTYGYLLQGDVLLQSGSYAEASVAYAKAQEIEPSGQILARYVRSLARDGKDKKARTALEEWLARKPDDSTVRMLYASTLIRTRDFPAAIRENETLLRRFPNNAVLLNDLAWLYGETKDDRAIEFAEKAHKLAPESAAITDTLGWLLVRGGKTEKGLELLRKAHAGAPEQHDIGYHLAVALVRTGDKAGAQKMLKDILDTGRQFDAIEAARKLYAELATK